MSRAWPAFAAGLLFAGVALAWRPFAAAQTMPVPIAAEARPVRLDAAGRGGGERAGQLTFAGELELKAPGVSAFGGLSGLAVREDGRFLSQTDAGDFIAGRIELDPAGRLAGVSETTIARLSDENGVTFPPRKTGADAEDIALLPDGGFAVSFEGRPRVIAYDGRGGARRLGVPADAQSLPPNEGLEALAAWTDGAGRPRLVEGAEDGRIWSCDAEGRDCARILDRPPERGFHLTGLDALPGDRGLVALYRAADLIHGFRALVAWVRPDAPEKVVVLARLGSPWPVDNMEGVAATPKPDGSVRLYLVSDDNFSPLQRTLLLALDWTPPN